MAIAFAIRKGSVQDGEVISAMRLSRDFPRAAIGASLGLLLYGCGGGGGSGSPPGNGSPGTLALSSASTTVAQSSGTATITVLRSAGSSGAASVHYVTSDGSATAGSDYTAAVGDLNWADGDSASKTLAIAVSTAALFTGSRNFSITLSAAGGAGLGTPAVGNVTINGSLCTRTTGSWTTTGAFDSFAYGNYIVNNNNWGGTAGQEFWSNSESCWGVTTGATSEQGGVSSYPSATRGWSQNASIMQQLSTAGTDDWTTRSGMGILVSQLTKAKVRWSFVAPTTGSRWLGLMDNYFHSSPTPSPNEFPPVVDLMIDQAIMDQVIGNETFYGITARQNHAATRTLGNVRYLVYIDDADELAFSQPAAGGHTIHLFTLPTDFTDHSGPAWGVMSGSHDLKAIIDYFSRPNPLDDAGNPLLFADGRTVTGALIGSGLYLNAINAGWEIDFGSPFTNTGFCVAVQGEADCP